MIAAPRLSTGPIGAFAALLVLGFLLAPAAPARADIVDCTQEPDRHKRNTYLDDVQFGPGASEAAFATFAKFIRRTLRADIQAIQSDTDTTALIQRVCVCKDRKPSRVSFGKDNQVKLSENSVLLEIWVMLEDTGDEDSTVAEADVYFAAPLAAMSLNLTGDCVQGTKATLRYDGPPSQGNILMSVKTGALVYGYAAIGGCILAKQKGDYVRAFELLNRADCQLGQSGDHDAAVLVKKLRTALVKAAEADLGKAVVETLKTPLDCP
jgi:hypothetical protein